MRTRRSQRHAGFLLSTVTAVAITGLFTSSCTEGDVVQASDRAPATPVSFPAPVDMALVAPQIQASQDQAASAYLASVAYLADTHRRELRSRRVEAASVSAPAVVSAGGSRWDAVAACESGGRWDDTRGGYEGGVHFMNQTWLANGGGQFAPHANLATRDQQIIIAKATLRRSSVHQQWPVCGPRAGLTMADAA